MQKFKIQDFSRDLVLGTELQMPAAVIRYQDNYFESAGSLLAAKMDMPKMPLSVVIKGIL
jgi:hypothetical protein